jgi:hypothetical protein
VVRKRPDLVQRLPELVRAQELKLARFGQITISVRGIKVAANASKHAAVSYQRAGETIARRSSCYAHFHVLLSLHHLLWHGNRGPLVPGILYPDSKFFAQPVASTFLLGVVDQIIDFLRIASQVV